MFYFIFLEGEPLKDHYIKKLKTPPLSTEGCNSTANFAGSLPDDLICIEDVNKENEDECQINVSILIQSDWRTFLQLLVTEQKLFSFSQTDEGAPLMCYSNSKGSWQMKGILSYRNGCRRHTLPAVYSAFTPSLLKWITKTIGNEEMIQRRSGWIFATNKKFLYIFYWNWKRLDKMNEK